MGRLREAVCEEAVCALADRAGILHMKMTPRGQRGWNDRLFLLPLRPLLIEFKSPGEAPRRLQVDRHEALRGLHYDTQIHEETAPAWQAICEAIAQRRREYEALVRGGLLLRRR